MTVDTLDPVAYAGLRPVRLREDKAALVLLDQRELPLTEVWLELTELEALLLRLVRDPRLRERVGAHFSSDYRSPTDLRLSTELQRIEFEETAGEIGALLREAVLVKAMLPAHNHALRRKADAGVLELPAAPGPPRDTGPTGRRTPRAGSRSPGRTRAAASGR